jgi:hypothetical protein
MTDFIGDTIDDISDSISGINPKWLRLTIGLPIMAILAVGVMTFALIIAIYQTIKEE